METNIENSIQTITKIDAIIRDFNIDNLLRYIKGHLISALLALILIVFFKKIRNFIRNIFAKTLNKMLADNIEIATFCVSIISIIIDLCLAMIIIRLLGINLTKIGGMIGALSLVIGFSFKEILSNFLGGIILLTFKPFKVEDVIKYGDYEGVVKKVEIFYTTLVDFQDSEIIIPNANIIGNEVTNINDNAHRWLITQIGVGYGSDIELVKRTIKNIIENRRSDLFYIEGVEPIIGMSEIGASSLNFEIRVYVREKKYILARNYLNESIKIEFDKLGIDLPYNIIDLQLNKEFNSLKIEN